MTEIQKELRDALFIYRDKQGLPYEFCRSAIRPLVSEDTVNTCLKVIDGLRIDFHFGIFCNDDGIYFEIDKSPEHFVNFCIWENICTGISAVESDGKEFDRDATCDIDAVISYTNSVFA